RISEFTVLLALSVNPGIRQGVLADVLKIKWSNMTKLVRALEERGLIARHIPHDDRRSVVLSVSEAGRRQIDTAAERMYRSVREALSMLSDAEDAELIRLSRKIAGGPEAKWGAGNSAAAESWPSISAPVLRKPGACRPMMAMM